MQLTGALFIAGQRVTTNAALTAENPATGEPLEGAFSIAGDEQIAEAARLAADCFDAYRECSPARRAAFLEAIAAGIEGLGDALIARAHAESGLPLARLQNERGRTCGQLRLFADVLRAGDYHGVRIDPALPDRAPPRPDLRQRMIALGPVAVFGASNFPLAFSVAGGDTASALAAGCPVVVKGHPAHPGTSELVAGAITAAAASEGIPAGVFSLVNGGAESGLALVSDPRIKAVGFTGSRGAGLALADAANRRAEPIPVYAEMSSINPVLLMPAALAARVDAIAEAFAQSLTMGSGQFCTNPGVLLGIEGPDLDAFAKKAAAAVRQTAPTTMLTAGICDSYRAGVARLIAHPAVAPLAIGSSEGGPNQPPAALFSVSAEAMLADISLHEEIFGAAGLIVRCKDAEQMRQVLEGMEGQLTATLQIDPDDYAETARLMPVLERKAGRILANGWPTGVEVCHAMVHGGPFPATSDARSTSVGSLAIDRFLRPVCYQALPDELLPDAVRDGNPLGVARLIDGGREATA